MCYRHYNEDGATACEHVGAGSTDRPRGPSSIDGRGLGQARRTDTKGSPEDREVSAPAGRARTTGLLGVAVA